MGPFLVVELEIISDPSFGFGRILISFQIYFFVFETAPHPFDEDIVDPSALAVRADPNTCILENLDPELFLCLGS